MENKELLEKHKGALYEILAVSWLLKQGYEVHRNISQHGTFDMIIYNPNTHRIFGVDVTSRRKTLRKKKGWKD